MSLRGGKFKALTFLNTSCTIVLDNTTNNTVFCFFLYFLKELMMVFKLMAVGSE